MISKIRAHHGTTRNELSPASAKLSSSDAMVSPFPTPPNSRRFYLHGAAPTTVESKQAMVVDATTKATITSQLKKAGRVRPTPADAGVLYLGHIPHGFYEQEMKGFFSQFGTVSRLRLARNKKTGRSKHYAFIEFKVAEVAEVVAKSMNRPMNG